jgi:TRAP-type uncharacterized transport system fused permease subunit
MSVDENKRLEGLDAEQEEKIQELLQKDTDSGRSPRGPWRWLVAILGGGMVMFYFYTAGLASVATQYHRGVYVLVTYVLVFLLYPSGGTWYRYVLAVFVGALLSMTACAWLFFPDAASFHAALVAFGDAWSESGALSAIGGMSAPLWFIVVGTALLGGIMVYGDTLLEKRYPQNPVPSDVVFALASAAVVMYWITEFEALNYRAGAETELDALISIAGILISLEVCRRVLGWSMTLIGVGLICYGLFGQYFPDMIAHRGFGVERLATSLYLTTNGVFGVMANVLATYVILFIFFGAFLHKSGAGRFFIELPMAAAGRSTGGPAKVAVVASALFGSVSGSAIANTVSTGAFTIPLMKRAGFRPHVAGAIEPSASIGGMFMPPIMGAGGFLMAELTETPYSYIMLIAIFPAFLYFYSVFAMIHFEAKKHNIRGRDHHDPDGHGLLARLLGLLGNRVVHRRQLGSKRNAHGAKGDLGGYPDGRPQHPDHRRHCRRNRRYSRYDFPDRCRPQVLRDHHLGRRWQLACGGAAHRARFARSRHGRTGYGGLPDRRGAGRASADGTGCGADRRAHDRVLVQPGFEYHAACLRSRLCGGSRCRLGSVEDGVDCVQVRQAPLCRADPVRLYAADPVRGQATRGPGDQ